MAKKGKKPASLKETGPLPHAAAGEDPCGPAPELESDETEKKHIVTVLNGYFQEADNNRKGGLNPRDLQWQQNLDLYWNRVDFSGKADWQAREKMPEVPGFVDRFAGAVKEALVSSPNGFYSVSDPYDEEGDMEVPIKAMTDIWLSTCGRNQTGHCLDFASVFEEQVKMGALMAMSSTVTWKGDSKYGRVAIETTDPRHVWLDHTYRNLYRIRQIEVDKHDLKALAQMKDSKGRPIYDLAELDRMANAMYQDLQTERAELTGAGTENISPRKPVILHEYIATVLDANGEVAADKALCVVADKNWLIRGPEKNPFWHGKDWMVYAPLVTAPLSVYGRTYMEDFGSLSATFNELTNLLLDATRTSAMKAYAIVPGMLKNPEQIKEGLSPNKVFELEDGYRAEDFAKALDLGTLDPASIQMWMSIKSELREAADINEIGMGQFAPKGRTSATEVAQTTESSSALIRSVAQTIEGRWLNPTLDLVWKTGLQHCSASDMNLANAVGPDLFGALMMRRKELIQRPVTFQAQGISLLLQKSKMLKSVLQLMGIIASNQLLLAEFMKRCDLGKLLTLLFQLSDIDMRKMQLSEREKMIQQFAAPIQEAGNEAQAATAQQPENPAVNQIASEANQALGTGM